MNKASGRDCAWSVAARKLTDELIADGILNQPIVRKTRKTDDIIFLFNKSGCFCQANAAGHKDDPLWKPTIIAPEIWEKVTNAFRLGYDLKYNVEFCLLPEMTDYVDSMTDDDLIVRMREFLLEHGVINSPIRQITGDTYYFNNEEIYTLDKGSQMFEYDGKMRFHLFQVTGHTSFNNTVWSKAMKQFKLGMTLTDCIRVFLDTKLEVKPEVELPFVERLIQRIEEPAYERVPENQNEATFDRVRVSVGLPRYLFDSWGELKEAILANRAEIDRRVLEKMEKDRHFKKFKVPINCLRLSEVFLRRSYSLEYIFELKERE